MYSLGLNNTPRISFKLVKSRIKNIRRFKQGAPRSKMMSADCHNKNGRTADCQSPKSTFESGLPQVLTVRRFHIRPESGG
jgi:hypothetical protein